jgi:hypothetical protein
VNEMTTKRTAIAIVAALVVAGALTGGVAYGGGGDDEGPGTEIEHGIEGQDDVDANEAEDGPGED